jgi:hypothetical protein
MNPWPRLTVSFLLAATPGLRACGACGCTLNTDWGAQGFHFTPGFSLDIRADYFDQDQLRSGTKALNRSDFPLPQEFEVQRNTLNRNLTLSLDYSPNKDWGFTLLIPTYNRFHTTYAEGDTDLSSSEGRGMGDLKVLVSYKGWRVDGRFGLQAGLKLPTGHFTDTFSEGPQAGQPLDRGLQLGTGTTDLLLGVFGFGGLSDHWDYYAHALYQTPLNSREAFRPSAGVNVTMGMRCTASAWIIPHIQVNLRMEGREAGANGDAPNSGATLAYLSPGATFPVGHGSQIYAFLQLPLLQRVNGLQIEPRTFFSVGFHHRF